jgi:calcineurin-like phosphoesterase family protein
MRTFLVSDTHFGHNNICKFLRGDGTKLRPWDTVQEMDEAFIQYWNETVSPKDKVYHLGDVVIPRRALATVGRLNGDKVLIKGNHDIFKLEEYAKYFRDIRACWHLDRILLSHIPIHPQSIGRWRANCHGHLHSNVLDDPRYINVSIEHTNWRPIDFEVIRSRVKEMEDKVFLQQKEDCRGSSNGQIPNCF